MKQLKKTLLTLVALLALTTQAWADDYFYIVISGTSGTLKYGSEFTYDNPYLNINEGDWYVGDSEEPEEWENMGGLTAVTIDASCNNYNGTSLHSLFSGFSGLTTINGLENLNTANVQDMEYMFNGCSSLTSLDLSSWNTASVTTMSNMFNDCSKLTSLDLSGWNTENVKTTSSLFFNCSELTTVDLSGWNTAKVWNTGYMFYKCSKLENIYVGDGWSTAAVTRSGDMFTGCTKLLSMNTANPATNKTNAHTGDGGYLKVKPAAVSGPEVAWNAASKTGTFTMPGGNVTLEPEYYPQAAVADGGVTAADADARATTDDPLVKVDATKLTGAKKLMYFVSNSGTAPAYDAEGWTDQLPTAEGFTQQGIVYVWYYPVGIDEGVDGATATYSDGDICLQSITARIAAAPAPDLSHTLADGSYYVKNGALSLYMAAGGSYGTQGIVNERGLDLIFTYNSGTKTYTIDSRLDNGGNNHFLNSGLYMDAPSFGWTVEGENSFTISANLDGVKHYLAVDQNNNLVYTEDGTAENAQWIIIPKADNENAVLAAGLNAMKAATAENGVDATFLIACPGFNRNDKRNAEAWTVEPNNLEMGSGSSDGNGCAGIYNSTFTLSQTLSNAPAGVYTLTAQGFYRQNGSDNENLPYFYANDEKQTFKLLEDEVYNTAFAGPVFAQGKYTIDPITVVVAEDGALTIGAKLETNTYNMLSCWDNFKLTYYGPAMYAVTFADDTEDADNWTASPNTDVKKGTEVTVTYSGSKKVLGVKAEKKAAAPSLNITNPVVGQVIGTDGKNYAAANVPSGVDKVAMIAYVSGSNGLAIALADDGYMNWSTAQTTCAAHTPVFSNGTWKLPTQDEWKQMFGANGGNEGKYTGLNTAITTAGGTAFQNGTVRYWSSSEYNSEQAYQMQFYSGDANWFNDWKVNEQWVRAVLAF